MNNKINKLGLIGIVVMMVTMSGCMSYMSIQNSKEELIKRKVYMSGDEVAIKAMNINGVSSIGVDISNWEAIKKHPWRQLGSAILDLGAVYLADQTIENLNTKEDKDEVLPVDQPVNIYVTVSGGNDSDIRTSTEYNITVNK